MNATDLLGDLSKAFRHVVPGAVVVGVAQLSHPSWFVFVDWKSWSDLLIIAIIAISVGNVWYLAHRYCVHQILDKFVYCFRGELHDPPTWRHLGYVNWLCRYVVKRYRNDDKQLFEHLHTRSAHVIVLFILCEALLVALCTAEKESILFGHRLIAGVFFSVILVAALWQFWIGDALERYAIGDINDSNHRPIRP